MHWRAVPGGRRDGTGYARRWSWLGGEVAHNHLHGRRAGNTGHREAARHTSRRLRLAFGLSCAILVAQLVGGVLANSLALLSDAGHVFTDIVALGLAWFASVQALRPATSSRTFGFHRAGILAALANALMLVAVALFITWEAVQRLQDPQPVESTLMLGVGVLGLGANLYVAYLLHGDPTENLNVRSALLHVIGDILSSVAVVVGAAVILLTGLYFVDSLLSVLIALVIVGGAWSIVMETVNILMEGTPKGINLERLVQDLQDAPGVVDAHDIHVWSLAAGVHAMSGHIVIEDRALSDSGLVLQGLRELLAAKYGIDHITIQLEHRSCGGACVLFEDHLPSD